MSAQKFAKNLSRYRLITFDITDTLLRFPFTPAIQYAKTASLFGYPDINQLKLEYSFKSEFLKMKKTYPIFGLRTEGLGWRNWWKMLVMRIFQESGANIPIIDLEKIADTLIDQYYTEECWYKVKGCDELLQKLKDHNKIIGVISNFDPRLHQVIKNLKLPEFNFVLTSYECGICKPDRRIFNAALIKARAKSYEALHIGNTLKTDYFGALNAGWTSLHISNSSNSWKGNKNVNGNHVYESIQKLLDTLENQDISWN